MIRLLQMRGLEQVIDVLRSMFGESPVNTAFGRYRSDLQAAGETGKLRIQRAGGLSAAAGASGMVIPKSTHFGRAVDDNN